MNENRTDVHAHFGLSYSNYQVLPRTLLQSMPKNWQYRYVALMEEFESAFRHVEQAQAYSVQAGEDRYLNECEDAELRRLGWDVVHGEHQTLYYSPEGHEVTSDDADAYHVLIPTADPVEHYDRGRTYVEPKIRG